jgi:hypothetical protein
VGERGDKYPIRETFPAGCASASRGAAKSTTATTTAIHGSARNVRRKRLTTFADI